MIEHKGYEFHGRYLTRLLFGWIFNSPVRGNLNQMVGFLLTPSRLYWFAALKEFNVFGCNANSGGGKGVLSRNRRVRRELWLHLIDPL